ncbi:MAG: hypothetical protein HQK77_22385 [Desulfobacterales bacterium]|nr:hypothetical protein [Desulfobacterales bacterium]
MSWILILLIVVLIAYGLKIFAEKNGLLPKLPIERLHIHFNGEPIIGHCLIWDMRSETQRHENKIHQHLDGDIVVFFHGHAQRANDGSHFTKTLCQKSKSRILILPLVYTPFGKEEKWRGDAGKMIILMAIVRYGLKKMGLRVEGFEPVSDLPVYINGIQVVNEDNPECIPAKLMVVGWSHGAALARLFAHHYSKSVSYIVQMSPSGFESWGSPQLRGAYLFIGFIIEVILISLTMFKGSFKPALGAGFAILKGTAGDFIGSLYSNFFGNFHWGKFFRSYLDMDQCAITYDDDSAPVPQLKHIVVLYGKNDTLFEPEKAFPFKNIHNLTQEEVNQFWMRYYPSALTTGASLTFKVLSGNHMGPLVYEEEYINAALSGINS